MSVKDFDELRIVYRDDTVSYGRMKATGQLRKWLDDFHGKHDFCGEADTVVYSARLLSNGEELVIGESSLGELFKALETRMLQTKKESAQKDFDAAKERYEHSSKMSIAERDRLIRQMDKTIQVKDQVIQSLRREQTSASRLPVVNLKEREDRSMEKRENEGKEPSITAIFKGYSEVAVKQNGLMISFQSKEDILEAFKALTAALDKADKEAIAEEMGFTGKDA